MTSDSKTIQTFQLQHQNETLIPQYNLVPLTMTDIKLQLYAIDENLQNSRHLAHQAKTQKQKSNRHPSQQKQKQDLSTVRCYKCNKMGHYAKKCPEKDNNQEQGNSVTSRVITFGNPDLEEVHANMVQLSNVGRKPLKQQLHIPPAHNLFNWVMDSGATCHMTPHKNGFEIISIKSIRREVEVADGHSGPAEFFGTEIIKTKYVAGENIILHLN